MLLKKFFYVALILCLSSSMAFAEAKKKESNVHETKFDSWKLQCQKVDHEGKEKEVCALMQQVVKDKARIHTLLLEYNKDNQLSLTEITLLGIDVQKDVKITLHGKVMIDNRISTCDGVGCRATKVISEELLAKFFDEKDAFAEMYAFDQQQEHELRVKIPLSGLKEGFAALKAKMVADKK